MTLEEFGKWLERFTFIADRWVELNSEIGSDQYDWSCGKADAAGVILEKWRKVKHDA